MFPPKPWYIKIYYVLDSVMLSSKILDFKTAKSNKKIGEVIWNRMWSFTKLKYTSRGKETWKLEKGTKLSTAQVLKYVK